MATDNHYGYYRDIQLDNGAVHTRLNDAQLEFMKHNNPIYFVGSIHNGEISGITEFTKFGFNSEIDTTSDPEDCWSRGGLYEGFPTQSETLEIFSDSAEDAVGGGTGATQVLITNLLDSGFTQMPDVLVTLSGTTPVQIDSNLYHRCSRMIVTSAGTQTGNVGTITLRQTTTLSVFAEIPPELNQSQLFCFSVPAGKTLYIPDFCVRMSRASGAAGSASIRIQIKNTNTNVWRSINVIEITDSQGYDFQHMSNFIVDEKTDINCRIQSVSDNDTKVTGMASGWLIDNTVNL